MTELSLFDISVRNVSIETTRRIGARLRDDICKANQHIEIPAIPSLPMPSEASTVDCLDLTEVFIRNNMLFSSGRRIGETRYLTSDEDWSRAESVISESRVTTCPFGDRIIIGHNSLEWNYFHWLTQELPALVWSFAISSEMPVRFGTLRELNSIEREAYELLSMNGVRVLRFQRDETFRVRNARFCTFLDGHLVYTKSDARRFVLQHLGSQHRPQLGAGPLVYVSRADAHRRKMLNEQKLMMHLERQGFRCVELQRYTLRQQISIFKQARVIVGAHGAGLANVVFCSPDTTVYELFQENYVNPCNETLAKEALSKHISDKFPVRKHADNVHECEWEADLDLVESKLKEVVGSTLLPSRPRSSHSPLVADLSMPPQLNASTLVSARDAHGRKTNDRVIDEAVENTLDYLGELLTGRDLPASPDLSSLLSCVVTVEGGIRFLAFILPLVEALAIAGSALTSSDPARREEAFDKAETALSQIKNLARSQE